MADITHWQGLVRSVVAGRPWVVAMDVLVPAAKHAEELLGLGAERVLAIGANRGAGDLPDPVRVPTLCMNVTGPSMMEAMRMSDDALANLPAELRDEVARFDPERKARVIGTIFESGRDIADRRMYGARAEAWPKSTV